MEISFSSYTCVQKVWAGCLPCRARACCLGLSRVLSGVGMPFGVKGGGAKDGFCGAFPTEVCVRWSWAKLTVWWGTCSWAVKCTSVRWPMQCTACSFAARCIGHHSVLRFSCSSLACAHLAVRESLCSLPRCSWHCSSAFRVWLFLLFFSALSALFQAIFHHPLVSLCPWGRLHPHFSLPLACLCANLFVTLPAEMPPFAQSMPRH